MAALASHAGLGTAMREEVWAIVRAAVEEATGPLVTRQRELEARVERAERERDDARAKAERSEVRPAGPATPATSYGVAAVAASPRREHEVASVGSVDVEAFDGRRRKRRVAAIVAALILVLLGSLVTMTILSHN